MRLLGLLLALGMWVAPAQGQPGLEAEYRACDGFGAPGFKYNGVQKGSWLWRSGSHEESVAAAEAAIAACDKTLADPMLVERYWQRRASLLQAKALHQIAARQYSGALTTLDKADSTSARELAGFEEPIRVTDQMLRATAFYGLGRKEEARAALKAVTDARPWSGTLRSLAQMIRLNAEPDYETHQASFRDEAVLNPSRLRALFWLSIAQGQFADAIAYSRQLVFEIPRSRRGWTMESSVSRQYGLVEERASIAGATAYAALATGDMNGSAQAYQVGLFEIEEAMQPPASVNGRPPSKSALRDYDWRKTYALQAKARLEDWGRAIRLRREVPGLTMAELDKWPDRPRRDGLVVASDFLGLLKAVDLRQAGILNELIEARRTAADTVRRRAIATPLGKVASALPTPWEGTNAPKMQTEGANIFRTDLNGYGIRKAEDPDLINIRFGDLTANITIIEEAAILTAANHSASLGKDGFIIEALERIERTMRVSGLYTAAYSSPSGYEVRLLIRPVSIAALPADQEGARWRIIRVADVQGRLAPKFATPAR